MLFPRSHVTPEAARFDAVSQVIEDSRSWIELRHIVSLSGVSLKHCREILAKLVASGIVGIKPNQGQKIAMGEIAYGKRSLVERDARLRESASEFRISKSIFALKPDLLNHGGQHPTYQAKPNQSMTLAMLTRRI